MALTSNNFLNAWALGANDVVGIEIPLVEPTNPGVGTYGFRSIGVPSVTCAIGATGLAYLTAVEGDAGRGDAEVLTIMQMVAGTGPYTAGTLVRGSGTAGSENGYFFIVDRTGNQLIIGKFVAGVVGGLGVRALTMPAIAEDWFIRFRVNGTSLKLRAWRYDAPEPATWDVSFTDAVVAGVGKIGFVTQANVANSLGFNTPGFISVGTGGETAPRPLTNLEQRNWLNDNSNPRVLIAQVGVLGKDAAGAALPSKVLSGNWPFVSEASDVPANEVFDDVMVQAPNFSSKASEQITGRSTQSFGDAIFKNENGVRDHWLTWNWDGRDFDMFMGGVGWRMWDFLRVLSGTVYEVYVPKRDQIGLKIRDKSVLLNRTIQTSMIGGTTANKGTPNPIAYGKLFNIEPKLIDAATFRYKFHDESLSGAVGILQVRAAGVSVSYTDQGNGEFTLNADPNGGRVTCDVNVDVSAASATRAGNRHNRAMQTLVEDRAGFGVGSSYVGMRSGSLALFGADPTDEIGLYLREETNFMNALDQLAISAGGFWYFNRLGLFCAALMRVPAAPYDHDLIEDDISDFKVDKIYLPSDPEQLGFQKNWTSQQDALLGSVSVANHALYATEAQFTAQIVGYDGLDQPANHALRRRPVNRVTLFYNSADALAELLRNAAIYGKTCALVSFETKVNSVYYNLGEALRLTYSRFGFSLGKAGVILGLDEDYTKASVRITMFVQISGQFPVTTTVAPYVTAADFYRGAA